MLKQISLAITFGSLLALQTLVAEEKPGNAALNDAQIAMIAVTANTVDIDAGKMAQKKAHSQEVKDFAEMMVRDHTSVNEKATALAKKLGVTPEESDTSKSLKSQAAETMKRLKALEGDAFDKAYVDNEVSYHQSVIGVVEKTLIPNTQNAELKSLLESAGPVFQSHLEHAKMLQKSLNK
jgi:putative membrane protein